MSEKKTFSVSFSDHEKSLADIAMKKGMELFETSIRGETLFKIFEQWLDLVSAEEYEKPEAFQTDIPDQLEALCELDFLKKIIEPKKGVKLWHCLKNQRPDGKGKPILMADGRDRESIYLLCKACETGFVWHEQRSKMGKTRVAIKRFGDMPVEVILNVCKHPASTSFQVNLMNRGTFYCKIKDDNVTIQRTCIPDNCEYLVTKSAPIQMKETEAFKEVTKQLEDLG